MLRPCPVYTIFFISRRQSVTWKEKEEMVRVMVSRVRKGVVVGEGEGHGKAKVC